MTKRANSKKGANDKKYETKSEWNQQQQEWMTKRKKGKKGEWQKDATRANEQMTKNQKSESSSLSFI